jgi:hypothetical protein
VLDSLIALALALWYCEVRGPLGGCASSPSRHAFDCRFVSETLVGEMRVILGRGRAEIFPGEACRMAALRAEIRSCGKPSSATSAAPAQRRSALLAELCRDRVLVLTCRAFHAEPCSKGQSIA